jgi:hypothetical protein
MINQKQYEWAVDVLVKAYVDGMLQHSNCHACAVGNMIADREGCGMALNENERLNWKNGVPMWFKVFGTCSYDSRQFKHPDQYHSEAKRQIDSTGYTWQELARIEYAFETGYKGDDLMFAALMSVIDVLDDIHQVDQPTSTQCRARFKTESHV